MASSTARRRPRRLRPSHSSHPPALTSPGTAAPSLFFSHGDIFFTSTHVARAGLPRGGGSARATYIKRARPRSTYEEFMKVRCINLRNPCRFQSNCLHRMVFFCLCDEARVHGNVSSSKGHAAGTTTHSVSDCGAAIHRVETKDKMATRKSFSPLHHVPRRPPSPPSRRPQRSRRRRTRTRPAAPHPARSALTTKHSA
jgi:hypothetical protein